METTIIYWGNIGRMQKKMETIGLIYPCDGGGLDTAPTHEQLDHMYKRTI